jgi:hypothetical protein
VYELTRIQTIHDAGGTNCLSDEESRVAKILIIQISDTRCSISGITTDSQEVQSQPYNLFTGGMMDKNEAWRVWSQRIPADTTLEQAFKAGFVAGQETPARCRKCGTVGLLTAAGICPYDCTKYQDDPLPSRENLSNWE